MFIQKVEKSGIKYFAIGDKLVELAPLNIVKQIATEYEITGDFNITYTKEVEVLGKIELNGWIKAPAKPGNYKLSIKFVDEQQHYGEITEIGEIIVKEKENPFIQAEEVKNIYKQVFGKRADTAQFIIFDSKMYKADLNDIRAVLSETKINQLRYTAEFMDCDDFMMALLGAFHANPYRPEWKPTAKQAIFGTIVWWEQNGKGYGHALCSATNGKEVWMIEPQTEQIFSVPESWNLAVLFG